MGQQTNVNYIPNSHEVANRISLEPINFIGRIESLYNSNSCENILKGKK